MGFNWKRKLLYYYAKIVRADGTPEYIARGWALGMFIGCLIPMSFQLMISIPLSFVIRGSKIGAALGTLITNPVSVIFIYPVQCYVGNLIIGRSLTYKGISESLKAIYVDQSWSAFLAMGWDLILSFFAGGMLFALIMTPPTYFLVKLLVLRYRSFKEKRREKRAARLAARKQRGA